ncbi:hypothetical protein SBA3_1880007 [Candidatus Sulfopaludibacter sp. SbA3]|nr:hypothetical protein SBA3_1880007 [Candidatus Sulfopaludibacter sp. SbA3]
MRLLQIAVHEHHHSRRYKADYDRLKLHPLLKFVNSAGDLESRDKQRDAAREWQKRNGHSRTLTHATSVQQITCAYILILIVKAIGSAPKRWKIRFPCTGTYSTRP